MFFETCILSSLIYFMVLSVFFTDMLTEDDETLVKFGIGGLCNLALGKLNLFGNVYIYAMG